MFLDNQKCSFRALTIKKKKILDFINEQTTFVLAMSS